ncbi:MAG: AMIN domain-containing protein, partial [Leptolyngbyaceae cyanobacterium bins.59]|nr:AMIN domain-containing protein [Leptolyngbyaceae cyanobacterium bins.59]
MKDYFGAASFLVAGAIVVAASQPVWAQSAAAPATQVTGVQTKLSGGGVQVMLETRDGNRPQVFSTVRGKSWVADVINTQLRLPGTLTFRQDNPAPGIASVEVFPLDANSIRVRVTGQNNSPTGQMDRNDRGLVISLAAPAGSSASAAPAQPSISVTRPTTPNPGPIAQTPAPVPTTPGANPAQPVPANINVAPPFLPRAVAPPVGDIAVSSVDIAPTTIDLGTAERIPRLVLREAPVREVLSLLSRAAGLNIAFSETGTTAAPAPGGAAAPAGAAGATISLDIENEPVQDVFNYVLRLSGLQASRSGRTIFVGRSLPAESRGLIMRTLRLNQLKADLPQVNLTTTSTSASSLTTSAGQGGASTNSTVGRTSNYSQNIPLRGALQILVGLGAEAAGGGAATGAPATLTDVPLRGLTVTADSRTNSITLIGTPRVVDIATSFLTQLDVRKRQVAVNVKIVDINLLNTDSFSSSFSFGIADTFVSVDGGRATTNFGQFRPPNAGQVQTSLLGQTVINNPYSDA